MIADFLDADAVRDWLTAKGHSDLAAALPKDLPGLSIGSVMDKISSDSQTFVLLAKILRNTADAHLKMADLEQDLALELLKRCPQSSSTPTDTG